MSTNKQIFQTSTKLRWRSFLWSGRLIGFCLIAMVPVFIIAMVHAYQPALPGIEESKQNRSIRPIVPKSLTPKEEKKFQGFAAFLAAKRRNEVLIQRTKQQKTNRVRAAFYVDWDPQSLFSLKHNIGKLNTVLPEWFFLDPIADTLKPSVDLEALQLMKQHGVNIIPMLTNTNESLGEGIFDGALVHRILHNNKKRERLLNDIVRYVKQYGAAGVNIDFEELQEKSDEPIIAFQRDLYQKMHSEGLLVTQDVIPANEDFNVKELSQYNDYIYLMAYDQHYSTSVPGPVSAQRWIEKTLDEAAADVPGDKIILCVGEYGYDWPAGEEATTLTYPEALALAREKNATVTFDNDTYNCHFSYSENGKNHNIFFTDAASAFNTLRFADEYGVAGTALWRLGSEDSRLWEFYSRDLDDAALKSNPFDFSLLSIVPQSVDRPDYIGDGEVLDVLTDPQSGKLALEVDSSEKIIREQRYESLPTRYVIKKYGSVNKQVILTFDDGPDPAYTPAILDILKKEQVPAAFFVVGMNAEKNLSLLRRIAADGHEIGNHTFTHPNMAEVGRDRARVEMEANRLLIEAALGRSTVLFRAPYNADAEPTQEAELIPVALSKTNHYYTVGESIDPNDWEPGVSADSIYNRVVRQYEANPQKGIILLHDAGGDRQATVLALPRIIHYFKNRGVAFSSVAGLLHKSKDEVMPPVRNTLVTLNSGAMVTFFWAGRFLQIAFWLAIALGILRTLVMGVMAFAEYRRSKKRAHPFPAAYVHPPVSIIVPAFNEEVNAVSTVTNLLKQDYPSFDIIFIDDGSRDRTYERVLSVFGQHPQVKVLTKPNGGKASALNFGIAHSQNEFVVCIDADTQLHNDAVSQLMKHFAMDDPSGGREDSIGAWLPLSPQTDQNPRKTGAVAGNVKVGNENNLLTRWQSIEYITAQNFDRRAMALINAITVVPGAIGAFRKEAIDRAGGFTTDTLAEDCDLTMRILKQGYRVENCSEAIAVTEAPETLQQFMKQRFRWSYGVMQAFWKNRRTCFNPKYKGLGLFAMPNILFFQILLPLIAPLADLMLFFSLVWNFNDPSGLRHIVLFYSIFLVVDMLVGWMAFVFEGEKKLKLLWLIPQRFAYRQLMYVVLYRSLKKVIKGESQGWGILKRTGHAQITPAAPHSSV